MTSPTREVAPPTTQTSKKGQTGFASADVTMTPPIATRIRTFPARAVDLMLMLA